MSPASRRTARVPLNLPPIAAARPAPITPPPAPPAKTNAKTNANINAAPRADVSKARSFAGSTRALQVVASTRGTTSLVSTGERPRIDVPSPAPRIADAVATRSDAASFHFGTAPVAHAQACVTPERRRGLPVWITLSAGSVALIAAGYMGAMVQLGTKAARVSTTPRVVQSAPTPSAPLKAIASSAPPQTTAPARPEPQTPAASTTARSQRAHTRARTASTTSTTRSARAVAAVPSSTKPAPELEAPVVTIRPLSSTESSDTPSAPLSAAVAAAAEPSIGEPPSRDEVMRGLAGLRGQLIECAAGRHGVVETRVTIAPTGRVTYSLISGDFVGSPEGSCMARALRSATFPSFTGPSLKVLFPYSL